MQVSTKVHFSTSFGIRNRDDLGSIALCLGRYLLSWLEKKKNAIIFQTFSTTPSLPGSSPSIWQDTVWKASTQHPLEKITPCFYGLLGIMKLFSPTFIHTLTLMLLLPCMPGELNKVSVWILPSISEAVFFQVLPPVNLAFNQSTNTLANTSGFWGFLLRKKKKAF